MLLQKYCEAPFDGRREIQRSLQRRDAVLGLYAGGGIHLPICPLGSDS